LKQTFVQEGKELRRKAGGYAHAKQFKRLRRTVKRQRTILGIVLREIGRKLSTATSESPGNIAQLNTLLEHAERIRKQLPKDKNKLYVLHAPEVEWIGKGKARKSYEFGVKACCCDPQERPDGRGTNLSRHLILWSHCLGATGANAHPARRCRARTKGSGR
jgi:hypothetical protein